MAEDFIKPKIIDEEIILDPSRVIMSKTDKFGIFEFANDYFMEISGYEEYELMGKSMFCVQHPDMPEVIFKMMWEKLLTKQNFHVIVKNLTKSGRYYWSITSFTFKVDDLDDEIIAIYSKRIAANLKSIEFFSKLYKTLANIEKKNGIEAAEKFIIGFLEEKQIDFNSLVNSFYKNISFAEKPTNSLKPKAPKTIKKVQPDIITKLKSQQGKAKEIVEEKAKEIIEKPSNDKSNKGFFQKWFGKTEEEIEEERRRNNKK